MENIKNCRGQMKLFNLVLTLSKVEGVNYVPNTATLDGASIVRITIISSSLAVAPAFSSPWTDSWLVNGIKNDRLMTVPD
jgi:hypothetical protein